MDSPSAEHGENYLNSINFRSLIEWLTAETLLARPDDPLQFTRALIDEKMAQRTDHDLYQSQDAVMYLKQCYIAFANGQGRIGIQPRRSIKNKESDKAPIEAQDGVTQQRLRSLENAITSCHRIANSLMFPEVVSSVIIAGKALLSAEHVILYLYDESLKCFLAQNSDLEVAHVPKDKGIIGAVAASCKCINLSNIYDDDNTLDAYYDRIAGIPARSLLCVPIRENGNVIGVLQALNKCANGKSSSRFDALDEELLGIVAAQAGISVTNAHLYEIAREEIAK
ncbi:unnamed protein product [Albugo candida]|uniref:GAF domain-containing protein n=1 Tax=Albugo candida TaxID=65357 RepID=A0A024FZS3_9STRA|nr:unnamed protein product [Albugo candida]|eukprot:CCI39808.1 unnamed protein product [Albugo candida]